jgi:hypothetical protein
MLGCIRAGQDEAGGASMSDYRLSVCAEMVFTTLPIIDRVRRINDTGFAVEIWS